MKRRRALCEEVIAMAETKVNPYDSSTNETNGAYVPPTNPAYDPSTNGTNGAYVPPTNPAYGNAAYGNAAYGNAAYGNAAYDNAAYGNAAYPAGPTAPMDGGAPPSYSPAPMVQTMNVGVPVTTMITRQGPPRPRSFIIHNVMTLLFCWIIFGIIGIVKGSQVDSFYIQGQYWAAEEASLSANKWFNRGLFCGGVCYVIVFFTWMCVIFI